MSARIFAALFLALAAAGCLRADEDPVSSPADAPPAKLPPPGPYAGPNAVGLNCTEPTCAASCMDGSSILMAYGFHGRTFDASGPESPKCGEAVEWLGHCLGKERCEMKSACATSALYLVCR